MESKLPKNCETITISIPSFLLQFVDKHCQDTGLTRSGVAQKGIRTLLLIEKDSVKTWSKLYQDEFKESLE